MIVSRKNRNNNWETLRGKYSSLSGPCYNNPYRVNNSWHRLYTRSVGKLWDLNGKVFTSFKEA